MYLSLQSPNLSAVEKFLSSQSRLEYSYKEVFATKNELPVKGYDTDFFYMKIGEGEADFHRACQALRRWQMFPVPWTKVLPENAPIEAGTTVAMYARFFGIWWGLPCRILYMVDEPGRFGFAYGTLPGHIEAGEELFLVKMEEDGGVWYELKAFSKPRHWLAKVGYPLMRLLQARFRRDSAKQMKANLSARKKDL